MSVEKIKANLGEIQERIARAAERSGRTADQVKLVAVTKYVDAETTRWLLDAGHCLLGESRPQVLWDKAAELKSEEIQWHMIGHLQRNKVNRTVPLCALIHSVDSLRLIEAIENAARTAGLTCQCLLEVNISGESEKHGFQANELEAAMEAVAATSHVHVKGLMGMASLRGGAADNRREFAELRTIFEKCALVPFDNVELVELSMGMSGDFEAAIEEGATIVRIGSKLFEGLS